MEKYIRINVDIDDALMERAQKMTGIKTKKELVNTALTYYRDFLIRQKPVKEANNENQH